MVPIIVEECNGIDRINEPVTFGIPLPQGYCKTISHLFLKDEDGDDLPIQTEALAYWNDGSVKWLLIDSQISIVKNQSKQLCLTLTDKNSPVANNKKIDITEDDDFFIIDTAKALFKIDKNEFKPIDQVIISEKSLIETPGTYIRLTGNEQRQYKPLIKKTTVETAGSIRTTLKIEGWFSDQSNNHFADFFARLNFYYNTAHIKLDFTIHNPKAAKHPGGLWDLGDPGSIYFNDLSFHLKPASALSYDITYSLDHDSPFNSVKHNDFRIYQDSSGGDNWKSCNHVNKFNEVKTSFQGYRIYENSEVIDHGLRANPVMTLSSDTGTLSVAIRDFWQNFPKSMGIKENLLQLGLFPGYFDDEFELQGGEQKTHTVYLWFGLPSASGSPLNWINTPLLPRTTPEWYANTNAIPFLNTENSTQDHDIINISNQVIEGDATFFHRRERIDEYGWRNFGEFYADHESVNAKKSEIFVSHYNNQYDCIYGCLKQFLRSGKKDWFIISNQLCNHVKDIDIYHTDCDTPFYNHGLFWHTDHYIDAKTSTHRCFSKRNLEFRNTNSYGGGPSLSHNYATGLLLHYYLTGEMSSKDAVLELCTFILNNIKITNSIKTKVKQAIKQLITGITEFGKKKSIVQLNKVYGLNGPGRASGNALNSLLDAYTLTNDQSILIHIESLMRKCISPTDDIPGRDLLDVENRWMYTIFLQSLCKYLVIKSEAGQPDENYTYGKDSLLRYANWMLENEYFYLDKPEKLEYPNETWAVQELRKCNIFLQASQYVEKQQKERLYEKATYFYEKANKLLLNSPSSSLTRPIILILQNWGIYSFFKRSVIKSNN